jgi:hypothetical protein
LAGVTADTFDLIELLGRNLLVEVHIGAQVVLIEVFALCLLIIAHFYNNSRNYKSFS